MSTSAQIPRFSSPRWACRYLAYEHRVPNHPGKRTLLRLMLRASAGVRPRPFPWRMRNGAMLAISPFDGLSFPGTVGWTCFRTGVWEAHIERCLHDLLRPGDVALDIGANLGYFSAVMAQAVGAQGRVLAFEPVPQTFEQLRLCAGLNDFGWMTPLPIALGTANGSVEIAFDPRNAGDASMHRSTSPAGQRAMAVRMRRLDDLVAEGIAQPPALIKVDVEGHELEVLRGARETIAASRPTILFEYAPALASRAGWRLADLRDLVDESTEHDFFLVGEGLEPLDVDGWSPDAHRYAFDLVARPRSAPRSASSAGAASRSAP